MNETLEAIAHHLDRIATALEDFSKPVVDVPPDRPCTRCNGAREFAPGVTCTQCEGSGT